MSDASAIRLARPGDADAIAEFSKHYIEQGLGWRYTRPRILRAIASPTTNVAVLVEQARLRSFGIMDYGETSAHLVLLGVQPAVRGAGLGARMLSWLELCAENAALRLIRVEARADNPQAIRFYQRHGYGVRTHLPGYYLGRIDGVRLEKKLAVVVSDSPS